MRYLLVKASRDPSRYEVILEHGATPTAMKNVLRRLNPDLLVVGTRGRGRWRRALLGSDANQILSTATSDVLAVPNPDVRGAWRKARADRLALDVISGI
jgi:nucleotide-binding universal stress UspA family protein